MFGRIHHLQLFIFPLHIHLNLISSGISEVIKSAPRVITLGPRLQLHFYDENPYTEDGRGHTGGMASGCPVSSAEDVSLGYLSLPVSELAAEVWGLVDWEQLMG